MRMKQNANLNLSLSNCVEDHSYFFELNEIANTPPEQIIQIFSSSFDYICVFDEHLHFLDVSNSCTRNFKDPSLSKEFIIGKSLMYFTPEFQEYYFSDLKHTLRSDQIYEFSDYRIDSHLNRSTIYIKFVMIHLQNHIICLISDITSNIQKFQSLQTKIWELTDQNNQLLRELDQLECTIDVLLKKYEQSKTNVLADCCSNLEVLVMPMVSLLKKTNLNERQLNIIDSLESNLSSISDPFIKNVNSEHDCNLSSRELEIMNLIRQGISTKEISDILYLSPKTVDFHRSNIRKKLNLTNKKGSLRSYLLNMNYEHSE